MASPSVPAVHPDPQPDHWVSPWLWVYGTLCRGERNAGLLAGRAEYRGEHWAWGRLYAVADPRAYPYPAAVLQPTGQGGGPIRGELFYVPESQRAALYADLDRLEEIADGVYQVARVDLPDALVLPVAPTAVAYAAGPTLWALAQAGQIQIQSIPAGDWCGYRRQTLL